MGENANCFEFFLFVKARMQTTFVTEYIDASTPITPIRERKSMSRDSNFSHPVQIRLGVPIRPSFGKIQFGEPG